MTSSKFSLKNTISKSPRTCQEKNSYFNKKFPATYSYIVPYSYIASKSHITLHSYVTSNSYIKNAVSKSHTS